MQRVCANGRMPLPGNYQVDLLCCRTHTARPVPVFQALSITILLAPSRHAVWPFLEPSALGWHFLCRPLGFFPLLSGLLLFQSATPDLEGEKQETKFVKPERSFFTLYYIRGLWTGGLEVLLSAPGKEVKGISCLCSAVQPCLPARWTRWGPRHQTHEAAKHVRDVKDRAIAEAWGCLSFMGL